ncbi:sigma-70 family RNA polymerase sigma factor [Metabacillus niabensis]|uniref:RNA polymerase sigma-70 factor (ECF subfamily) n=1 Tax=Metabacillus niabensis TaxID=324854 RepID=A0ABT9Z162_9BACI|nr:sigma-70 family RNA polymerase sigma factor [Metabacillus niabensis]MDQ0225765.1 RNA polymerase sigma-70 factor (ECF subfamily) [Metabacillus niabensis]
MEESITQDIITNDRDKVLDQLMDKYGNSILHLAYSYVGNREIAEDLTQEIFVKCYQKLDQYQKRSSLKSWLWRIAINHCKDYLKSWHYKHIIISDEQAKRTSSRERVVEHEVIQKYEDEQLVHTVMGLPDTYREVLYLYYFEELTIKEISNLINVNQNTIKTRLKKAKEILKDRLEGKAWSV